MKKLILLLGASFFLQLQSEAQRIKKLEGDPSVMKDEKKVNIVFSYENMSVGKFDKESEYIASKKADYDKKEAGRGAKWEESWKSDRKSRFEPQFVELFMKYTPFAVGNYPEAKYTMLVNTTRTEPGYNIYITRKNAEIDMEVKIIETASKKTVAEYTIRNAPGRTFGGNDYDTGQRIEEAYAAAGKHFGKELKGDLK
ncbi:MAG TPA: hypothetical protein PLP34_03125 [Chitinophagaceae bacterium]|nr:hypothetical protein [Chitinophagaceae bacterium]HNF71378.1 hypothetical protein [Chitinophagaceae bacterium]